MSVAESTHRVSLDPGDEKHVRAFIDQLRKRFSIPGISVAVIADGNCISAHSGTNGRHTATPLSDYNLLRPSSVAKLLTSLVALESAATSSVSIDAPISTYLHELSGTIGDRIVLSNLLSNSAGYQGENLHDADIVSEYTWDDFEEAFKRRRLLFEPGSVFNTLDSAYVIAAHIVGNIKKASIENSFGDLLSQLGIDTAAERLAASADSAGTGNSSNSGTPTLSPFWYPSLAGPLLTIREVAQIGWSIASNVGPLSAQITDWLLTPRVTLPELWVPANSEELPIGFGMGCAQFAGGSNGIASTSTGSTFALRFDRASRVSVAIALYGSGAYLRDFALCKLMNSLFSVNRYPGPRASYGRPCDFALDALAGRYQGADHSSIVVEKTDDRLALKHGHNPSVNVRGNRIFATLRKDEQRRLIPVTDMNVEPFGFIGNPTSGEPYLVRGGSALKRFTQ